MNYKSKLISIRTEANEAIIDIDGSIGEGWFEEGNTIETVRRDIEAVSALKADTITVNVSSLGGDYYHGVGIHNVLKQSSARIEVNIMGYTASAGTLIAMAGDTIRMADNVGFLVHQAWTFTMGNSTELRALADDLDAIDFNQAKMYANMTGKDESEVLELMSANDGNGKWLTADEAKDFGFIDEVYTATRVAASLDKATASRYKIEAPKSKTIKSDYMNFESIMTELKSIKDSLIAKPTAKVDEPEPKADTVSAEELATINATIVELKETMESLSAQIEDLEAEKVDFEAEISELNSKVKEYEETLAADTLD